MAFFGKLKTSVAPPRFGNDEDDRIADVLHTSNGAILIGLFVILLHRLLKSDFDLVPSIASLSLALIVALILIHKGKLNWARAISLWSLLLFLLYQCYKDDGVHDISLFAFPGVLVMAALVFNRGYFLIYTGCTVVSIGVLGYLETVGVIRTPYSTATDSIRVFDLLAIFAITAVPIRLLADNFRKNLLRIRQNEEEINKRADQLKESEERYRTLFEGANDAIFIISGDRFVECNEMTLKMFGCEERFEIVNHHPWEFSPKRQPDGRDSGEKAREVIQAALGGTPQRFYWKHTRKNGEMFDAEVSLNRLESGPELLMQALVRDMTEHMRAEEALRESEERFRTLFENQGEGTGIVDEQERFVLCNPAAEAILGVPPGGLVGRSLREFVTPEQWALVQSQTSQRKVGTKSTYEMEVLRPDGKRRSLTVTATPRFQNGSYIGAFGIFRDTTEQKELQRELMQSQKIQSLGTLAGGIAHDFNNILGIILGYASKMEKGKPGPPELSEGLEAIRHAVGRGAGLVQQILTFARRTDVASKAMSVPDLVRELVSMLQRTFPKVISLRVLIEEDIPITKADQTQIHQALLNLSLNARDAMPGGGEIVITVATVPRSDLETKFPGVESDRYVRVSVTDSGTGMDKETKARAFDPFFTTKEKGKGTGLGLSVVYGIVQNHHGFIDVESAVDRGSTFSLFLPAPTHAGILEGARGRNDAIPGGSETILVVEDEQLLQDLICSRLEAVGYRVLAAEDGQRAVEIYANHKNEISLVFSDMGLPKMTGYDEFKKLKEINPDVRVVIAGGFLEPELKAEMLKQGARAFVQKPYDPDDILVVLREVLDAN
jgi:PAS domain S-box-containing protein